MTGFRPLGQTARWRMVYDELLVPAAVGDIVTYDQIGELLDLHPNRQRQAIHAAVRRAERELLEEKGHALMAEADVGYRIANAAEHVTLTHRAQRKATKALVRGHDLATRVDLSGVEPNTRNALEAIGNAFAMQMEFNRRFDVRQRHLEEAMTNVNQKQDRTADEVARLQERLRRVEDKLDE